MFDFDIPKKTINRTTLVKKKNHNIKRHTPKKNYLIFFTKKNIMKIKKATTMT
jgi:hypothetical protein